MDVALDCFPNGGCTTTCEALWMGVPVITKIGRSYVSRMSTAVLYGRVGSMIGVHQTEDYVALAIQAGRSFAMVESKSSSLAPDRATVAVGGYGRSDASLDETFISCVIRRRLGKALRYCNFSSRATRSGCPRLER